MIDLNLLKKNPDQIRAELKKRYLKEPDLDEVLKLDKQKRTLIKQLEDLRAKQKKVSQEIASLSRDKRSKKIVEGKKLSDEIKKLAPKVDTTTKEFLELTSLLPAIAHESVPVGRTASDNKVESVFGNKPQFDFNPRSHWQIANEMGWLDNAKAAEVSGSRFSYVKGDLVLLNFALLRFVLAELTQGGFIPMLTPTMVNERAMYGAGMFPIDKKEVYEVKDEKLFLIGTSEITLLNYHAREIIDVKNEPIRYAGFTTNYRREAGTYGKDMHGLIRGHQFDKLEMFIFSSQEQSWDILDNLLLPMGESILKKLGLHFRRVVLATGDLPRKMRKTYDLEVWLPSEKRYLELGSFSNAGDFQARRLNIKYKDAQGAKRFVHTLNGTALTFSRFPVVLIENFQQADGRVRIPEVLQPFMNNNEYLGPNKKKK